MFNLETFRLISKTWRRFLSLCLIVLIGSGFMMGLMSTAQLMRQSVDSFNDRYHLQDLQIYSQYGFNYEDFLEIRRTENVENAFASKMMDLQCKRNNGEEIIARVNEMNRSVNQFELVKGRLPEQENECVILVNSIENTTYHLGEHLLFYAEDGIENYLKYHDYMIVGMVRSPDYICKVLGTSNLKHQDLDLIVYMPNSNFVSEYFTTIFINLKNADQYLSYTKQYKTFVEENSDSIKNTAFLRQDILKEKIITQAEKQLEEAEKEFLKQKEEGQKKLDEAASQLNDANILIVNYEAEINILQSLISRLKATAQSVQNDSEDEINQIEEFAQKYDIDPSYFYSSEVQSYAQAALKEAEDTYNSLVWRVRKARSDYEKGLEEYKEAVLTFNEEIEKADIEIRKARQELNELPQAKWTILDRSSHYSSYMYDATCLQMSAIGYSLPIMFFLVAALVCLTTMTRLVDEQRGQIGIFVALGYSNKQIIGKYVSYALMASLIGAVIGIFLGQFLFPTVIYHTWRLMYDLPDFRLSFPIIYLLLSLLSFIVLMCLVTAYVVHQSVKESPSSLMRPKAPKNASKILLEQISFIWDRLSFTSKITARNLFRYKSRFLMTVIGVAGCTGLLVIGWGIKDSISDVIDIQFGEIFAYEYQIHLENSHHLDENLEILKADMNNETVASFMDYTASIKFEGKEDTASVIVIDPRDAFMVFNLSSADKGQLIKLNNDGIIVSEKFARNNGIHKGDTVVLESRNGLKTEVRVNDICEMYFQHYIFISDAFYEYLFSESVSCSNIAIKTSNQESLLQDCEQLQDFISVTDFSKMIEQFQTMIDALDLIIAVIIITAGSLAFVVLMNLTQVNIAERIREIATLKVLGFKDLEVNQYIFKEILLLTLIGAFAGLPLGVLEHHFIMNVINMEMVMFGMNISFLSFLYSFMITFIFTGIVLWFMRKPLQQISMVESLKSVE